MSILGKDCTRWWIDFVKDEELRSLSWQWLYCGSMPQVLFHAYIARWTSWGSKTVESPSNSTSNKLKIPIWETWCTILSPGSVWYKDVYGGRRLGRIGSCRRKMLLSSSAKLLLWWTYPVIRNHEGKKFTIYSRTWRGSNFVYRLTWRNKQNLRDLGHA